MAERAQPKPVTAGYPQVLHSLTSLRYFAAAWVVVFHFSTYFPRTALHDSQAARAGYLGVDFFFVLSGFILAHVYLAKIRERRFDYWGFIVRRVARVYPMHIATLLLTIALSLIGMRLGWGFRVWDLGAWLHLPRAMVLRGLFDQLVLIHAWGATPGLMFNLPSWSISAEWFAYLAFPALVLLLRGRNLPIWLVVLLAAVFLVALDAANRLANGHSLMQASWNIGALRILPEFTLGIALYRFGSHVSFGARGAVGGFAAGLALLAILLQLDAPPVAVALSLAGIVLCAADAERHGKLRILAHPLPVLLGEVSYSVYLLHFPVGVTLFEQAIGYDRTASSMMAAAWIVAVLALVTVMSWLSHRWFELPARQLVIAAGSGASPQLPPRINPDSKL